MLRLNHTAELLEHEDIKLSRKHLTALQLFFWYLGNALDLGAELTGGQRFTRKALGALLYRQNVYVRSYYEEYTEK